jgi:hypothetical protein
MAGIIYGILDDSNVKGRITRIHCDWSPNLKNYEPIPSLLSHTIMSEQSSSTLVQRSTPPPPSHENQMIPEDDIKTLQEAEAKQIFLTEKQLRLHITAIRQAIRSEGSRLRKKYKWLAHQNFLGAGCFLISVLALFLTAYLYLKRYIGFWLTIPLMALPTSILHELEHDLIHNLYFKGKQWVQNIMFTVIWFTKWHLNPWYVLLYNE